MTTIDDIRDEVDELSEDVLGSLEPDERLRLFIQAGADDDLDRTEKLKETAPVYTYEMTEATYMEGVRDVIVASVYATGELSQLATRMMMYEHARDQAVTQLLFHEALKRLSRGSFTVGDYGEIETPARSNGTYAYGRKYAPETAYLASKYCELFEDVPAELAIPEENRDIKYFPGLAATGLLAYRDDLSGEAFDALAVDELPSEAREMEEQLVLTVVELYTSFNAWRRFAEDHLGVTFDEFIQLTTPEYDTRIPDVTSPSRPTEERLENILSIKEDYLEAYPVLLEEALESAANSEDDEVDVPPPESVDLGESVAKRVAGLVDEIDLATASA